MIALQGAQVWSLVKELRSCILQAEVRGVGGRSGEIKCLPSWDTNAGPPSMIRALCQVPRPCWLYMCWSVWCFFFQSWRNVSLTHLMSFVLTKIYKTVLETIYVQSKLLRVIWEGIFLASPQFAQVKLLPVLLIIYWLFSLTPEK